MLPIVHIGSYAFYSFGFMIGMAICVGLYAFSVYFKRHNLPVNMWYFSLTIVPIGFFAARLDDAYMNYFRVLSHHPGGFAAEFAHGGLTYYGGLLTSLAAWIIFILVCRLPFLRTIDGLFCVGIAYAIGRIGCFLAGDGDYGVASNLPWAMSFPHGTQPIDIPVHPTMLYTTIWELAVFAFLWRLSNPRRHPPLRSGTLLGIYLILTSVGRLLVEFLSRNRVVALGLTEAQIVSLALITFGSGILIAVSSRSPIKQNHTRPITLSESESTL